MRQVREFGVELPFVQQTAESQKARPFVLDTVYARDLSGVGFGHGFTLRPAAIPDEGYSRTVFLLMLSVVSNTKSRSFE